MHRTTTIIAALATLTAISTSASAATLAMSTFDVGDEGWTAQRGPGATNYGVAWNAAGGNPTGHVQYYDQTNQDAEWFSAPTSFLGTTGFAQAVGNGGISFDWAADLGPGGSVNLQVAFTSTYAGGTVLFAEAPASINTGWNNYNFNFDSTTSWLLTPMNPGGNAVNATSADLTAVLSSLTGLYITGDIVVGFDGTCSLDNPTIYSVPAPGALALLSVAMIAGRRRRRS